MYQPTTEWPYCESHHGRFPSPSDDRVPLARGARDRLRDCGLLDRVCVIGQAQTLCEPHVRVSKFKRVRERDSHCTCKHGMYLPFRESATNAMLPRDQRLSLCAASDDHLRVGKPWRWWRCYIMLTGCGQGAPHRDGEEEEGWLQLQIKGEVRASQL